ncbi:MAG: hypothetical protein U1F50_19730 [Rubrivivax sp.]
MNILRVLAAAAFAAAALPAAAGDLFVVCQPGLTLGADEVRDVFLGDKQFAGPTKLVPVENGALQADFQARVLKVDAARYASIWSKKGFREGLTPPAVRGGDADVIAAVKANPGTVGYVTKAPPDLKVIQKY